MLRLRNFHRPRLTLPIPSGKVPDAFPANAVPHILTAPSRTKYPTIHVSGCDANTISDTVTPAPNDPFVADSTPAFTSFQYQSPSPTIPAKPSNKPLTNPARFHTISPLPHARFHRRAES
jgi:hypothetical protein